MNALVPSPPNGVGDWGRDPLEAMRAAYRARQARARAVPPVQAPPVSFANASTELHLIAVFVALLTEILDSRRRPRMIPVRLIQAVIAEDYGVSIEDMCSTHRYGDIVEPRQLGYFLCRTMTKRSFPDIGRHFGGRDHTTVLHGFRKIVKRLEDDPHFADRVRHIRENIEAGA